MRFLVDMPVTPEAVPHLGTVHESIAQVKQTAGHPAPASPELSAAAEQLQALVAVSAGNASVRAQEDDGVEEL